MRHRAYLLIRCASTLISPGPASLAPQGGRADQSRPRARERRARTAEHVRPAQRQRRGRRRSQSRSSSSPTSCCTSPPASSRPRAIRKAARPSSSSSPREPHVVPVGRLDADTTGALLLTNDGALAHRLAHPRYGVEKTYVAEVEGTPSQADIARACARASSSTTARPPPAKVRRLAPPVVELTIHEGRNRQVKRMLEAVGHPVTPPAPQRLCGFDARRARARPVARARALRSRASTTKRLAGRRPGAAPRTCASPLVTWPWFGVFPAAAADSVSFIFCAA